jgi:prevent-host-death family protein
MINVGISEFRANLNAMLSKVQRGEIVVITYRGEEVARVVPPDFARAAARQELEALRQTAVIGDVMSPLDETWDLAA